MSAPRRYTTEARLQAACVRAIRSAEPAAWIFHPVGSAYQKPGIPDLLVVVRGRLVGIELKNPGPGESREHALGRVTPQQRAELDRLRSAGAVAGVATSPEEAIALLRSTV